MSIQFLKITLKAQAQFVSNLENIKINLTTFFQNIILKLIIKFCISIHLQR